MNRFFYIIFLGFLIACRGEKIDPQTPEPYVTLFKRAVIGDIYIRTINGINDFSVSPMKKTLDGVIVGYTYLHPYNPNLASRRDIRLVKHNLLGDKIWERSYTNKNVNYLYSVDYTMDNGFIIAGAKALSVQPNSLSMMYLIKTDSEGNKIWESTFGSKWFGKAIGIDQNTNSDYYVLGRYGKEMSRHGEDTCSVILKINSLGDSLWAINSLNSTLPNYRFRDIQATSDNGFIAVSDVVVKGNSEGGIEWIYEAAIAPLASKPQFYSGKETEDGYILFGNHEHNVPYNSQFDVSDFLIVLLDKNGQIQFSRTYDIGFEDEANHISLMEEGGFLISGFTRFAPHGRGKEVFMRLDEKGNMLWIPPRNSAPLGEFAIEGYHLFEDQYIMVNSSNLNWIKANE